MNLLGRSKKSDTAAQEAPASVRLGAELDRYRTTIGEHHAALADLATQITAAEQEGARLEVDAVLSGGNVDETLAEHQAKVAALQAQHTERETARRRAVIVSHDLERRHGEALRAELERERAELAREYNAATREAQTLLEAAVALLARREAAAEREQELRHHQLLRVAGGSPAPSVITTRWLPDSGGLGEQLAAAKAGHLSA